LRKQIAVVLFTYVLVGTAIGADSTHNGYWWNENSASYKLGYVNGYASAMVDFSNATFFGCLARKHGGKAPEKMPPREEMEACNADPTMAVYDFGELRVGQVVEGVDEFYKDFRNKTIHINLALAYVKDQLKGKKTNIELEQDLAEYRRLSAGKTGGAATQ